MLTIKMPTIIGAGRVINTPDQSTFTTQGNTFPINFPHEAFNSFSEKQIIVKT
jgi:hypothetical protein